MRIIESFETKKSANSTLTAVNFDKKELSKILRIYGKMVSLGEWRDYSMSSSLSSAIFSVFRRSSEKPLYSIIKTPKLSKQNRLYSIVAMNGQIIKQGKNLNSVLQVFNKKLFKIL